MWFYIDLNCMCHMSDQLHQYYCMLSGFTLLCDNTGCHEYMAQIRIHAEFNLHFADADFRWIHHVASVYYKLCSGSVW